MKNILLLTDFSDNAKSAIYYALSLFKDSDAHFIMLHGMYLKYSKANAPALPTDVRTEFAKASFAELMEAINKDFPGNDFDIKTEIWCGEVLGITSTLVAERQVDLIIMGARGISGFADVLMGHNTITVMEQVHCAVLAVPADYQYKDVEKIVLAMDQGEGPSDAVMKPMLTIAEKFDAQVLVLHVSKEESTGKEVNYDRVNNCLKKVRSHCMTIYDEDVEAGLGSFVRDEKVEMLAMIKQKLNFFERVFHRSLSNKMVLKTDVPILVMSYKK
ncbi:MAG: universal stress protein [Cyclobacteriaceae bacterium]